MKDQEGQAGLHGLLTASSVPADDAFLIFVASHVDRSRLKVIWSSMTLPWRCPVSHEVGGVAREAAIDLANQLSKHLLIHPVTPRC